MDASFVRRNQKKSIELITPYNAAWVETLKHRVPPSYRDWNPDAQRWTIHDRYVDEILELMNRFFEDVEELFAYEPPPPRPAPQPTASSNPRPAAGRHPWTIGQLATFRKLGIYPTRDKKMIDAGYRIKAQEVHPDVTRGDGKAFIELQNEYEQLKKELGLG